MSFIEFDEDGYVIAPGGTPVPAETFWYSVSTPEGVARIEGAWPAAPVENLELCALIFETAREQVIAYAPAIAEGEQYPRRYTYAQLQQAKNLWNAGNVGSTGDLGGDGYTFTPRPLDKTIRGVIRPTQGVADVF